MDNLGAEMAVMWIVTTVAALVVVWLVARLRVTAGLRLTLLGDYTTLLASQNQWAKVLKQAREAPHLEPGASIDEKPHHPVMMTAKTRKEPRNAITSFLLKNYVYFYRGKPIFFYTIHV